MMTLKERLSALANGKALWQFRLDTEDPTYGSGFFINDEDELIEFYRDDSFSEDYEWFGVTKDQGKGWTIWSENIDNLKERYKRYKEEKKALYAQHAQSQEPHIQVIEFYDQPTDGDGYFSIGKTTKEGKEGK